MPWLFLGSSRIKVTNTFLAICLVYPEYPALCQTLGRVPDVNRHSLRGCRYPGISFERYFEELSGYH